MREKFKSVNNLAKPCLGIKYIIFFVANTSHHYALWEYKGILDFTDSPEAFWRILGFWCL